MDNNKKYTIGDKETIIHRLDSIHTVTINCPTQDIGMRMFFVELFEKLKDYYHDENTSFTNVPVNDVYNCFKVAIESDTFEDKAFLYRFLGVVMKFRKLRYMSIRFMDNDELYDSYMNMMITDKDKYMDIIQSICNIDVIELRLRDMFIQEYIDVLNMTFMMNGIIKNSYLEREFILMFAFDDYSTYMNMLINNMVEKDNDIADYLMVFPKLITLQKPTVRVITDYGDI